MKLTPLMKQYWDVKSAHPDKVVLFRMGDFYEMFHDDALTAAPVLGIALTKRNPKDETPMCGVPHHSAEGPVNKLLRAGFKVAICEQLEDPAQAKGIVKRGVTRILTPGMVYDPDLIPKDQGNYICSFDESVVAFVDASTGEGFYYELAAAESLPLIEILKPVEFLLSAEFAEKNEWIKSKGVISIQDEISAGNEPPPCRRLRAYIENAQGGMEPRSFEKRIRHDKFCVTSLTLKHLEVFETYQGDKSGSLFFSIDRTKTSLGARQLRRWLSFPETREEIIQKRLDRVESWIRQPDILKTLRSKMSLIGDMERRLGRLFLSNANARDLLALAQSLHNSFSVLSESAETFDDNYFSDLKKIVVSATQILEDNPPIATKEGGIIRRGADSSLDELIDLTSGHSTLLQKIEQREREASGISSLKVKYNGVFGYFIEITNTHKERVPKNYIRKQTLAQAERYTTDELIQLEEKILSARSRRFELEFEIFSTLRNQFKALSSVILKLSQWIGDFDATLAFAWLALEKNYVRAKVDASEVKLLSSRHPVVEQTQKYFVPNDIQIRPGQSVLLTGPNMAGKSTLMRQIALSALLNQAGGFVPAREASLPIFTKILTRIGSSDNLSEGLSTFMVEMKETAELVSQADSQSLIILDEIGRGTATFDGMCLAQSILEHLHQVKKSTILFATHYHELAGLESDIPGIYNFHMEIRESSGDVKFLYQLKKGPAGKSYGIQVGTLAGLPKVITQRAQQILASYESQNRKATTQMNLFDQVVVEDEKSYPLEQEIRGLDLNNLTPLSALLKISEWHQKLS